MCISCAVYATFEGLRYLAPDIETDMIMTYLQFIGVAALIPTAILFTLAAFGMKSWINRTIITLLSIGAVATLILVGTDPLHHLVYTNWQFIEGSYFPLRVFTPGILWWAIVIYSNILLAALTLLLIHIIRNSAGIHRTQATLFLATTAIAWMAHTVYITGNSPIPLMDITPLAFILVAAAMAVCFLRYNLLEVLPIAWTEIFMGFQNPVLVLDGGNHLLDLNPAAEALLGIQGTKSFGHNISQLLEHFPAALESLRDDAPKDFATMVAGHRCHFGVRFSPLTDRHGGNIGRIIIFQDVTEHKRANKTLYEAERLEGVLEMAGAICHDLSQPAMAVGGYAELLLAGVSDGSHLRRPLTRLIESVEKLGKINKKLLMVTQKKPPDNTHLQSCLR
jgi:PAS domain S-box-containing protein